MTPSTRGRKRAGLSAAFTDVGVAGRSPRYLLRGSTGKRFKLPLSSPVPSDCDAHLLILQKLARHNRTVLFTLLENGTVTVAEVCRKWEELAQSYPYDGARADELERSLVMPAVYLDAVLVQFVARRSKERHLDQREKEDAKLRDHGRMVTRFIETTWPKRTGIAPKELTADVVKEYVNAMERANCKDGGLAEASTRDKNRGAIISFVSFLNTVLTKAGHPIILIDWQQQVPVAKKKSTVEIQKWRARHALSMQQAKDFCLWLPTGIELILERWLQRAGRAKGRVPFVGLPGVADALQAMWAFMAATGLELGAALSMERQDIVDRFEIHLHPVGRRMRAKTDERPRGNPEDEAKFLFPTTPGVSGCTCASDEGYCAGCDWAWTIVARYIQPMLHGARVFKPFLKTSPAGKELKKGNDQVTRTLHTLVALYNAGLPAGISDDLRLPLTHTTHDFRHSFACFWSARGAFLIGTPERRGERFVKEQLGHGPRSQIAKLVYAIPGANIAAAQKKIAVERAKYAEVMQAPSPPPVVRDLTLKRKAG
jgi:integrase